jgi:hypothetical protein
MKRSKDMMQTSNAIVIQPLKEEVVTQEVPKMSHQENNFSLIQNNNINHLNVKRSAYIKFVPKCLQHYQAFLGKGIKDLYGRVWLAAKKLNVSEDQESMQKVGFIALEQIKQYIKTGKQLSTEQQLKLAYKIAYNQLQQRLDTREEILENSGLFETAKRIVLLNYEPYNRDELNELGVY